MLVKLKFPTKIWFPYLTLWRLTLKGSSVFILMLVCHFLKCLLVIQKERLRVIVAWVVRRILIFTGFLICLIGFQIASPKSQEIRLYYGIAVNLFFRRLKLYAFNKEGLFEASDAGRVVAELTQDIFWCPDSRRELLFFITDRWKDFDDSLRRTIVNKIMEGPCNYGGGQRKSLQI